MQELVESRGGSLIRGEVLSWMTFVQFVANVSAPMVLGSFTAMAPADARYMFLAAACTSLFAGAMLQRIVHLRLLPRSAVVGARNAERSKRSDNGSSPGDAVAIQWDAAHPTVQGAS